MEKEKQNKKREPSSNKAKMVTIKVNPGCTIAGIGEAGDEVQVSELVASNFVGQGLATIIEKEK